MPPLLAKKQNQKAPTGVVLSGPFSWSVVMFFRLNTRKAIEATATLLKLAHCRFMSRKRLLAILYIADRESIKRTGRPIIGGRLTAMKYGPIHSEVYDFIKGGRTDQAEWSFRFENEGFYVKLKEDCGVKALSRYEVNLLNELSAKYLGTDEWEVADETHAFDEYLKTYKEGTSTPILLRQVIEAVGRADDADAILQDAKEKDYFDHLFSGPK